MQNSSDTLVTRQNLGDSLRNRLNVATTLLNQNSIPDVNTMAADPLEVSGSFWQVLHAVPDTIAMPAKGTYAPVLYYEAPVLDTNKNFVMRGVSPYQDEFVLYLDGTTKQLKLRTLANPEASGNRLATTCPQASGGCAADAVLADDISAVTLKYFSKSGNIINRNDVLDPEKGLPIGPDFPDVEVVELTITLKKRAVIKGTATSESNTNIRVALRNG